MEDVLQDYYTNDLKRISPGLACGDFKMENSVGCFKLIVDEWQGRVVKLIYVENSGNQEIELYEFVPSVNYVYIEKIFDSKLVSSGGLPEYKEAHLEVSQPSLRLVFFGKSAVVFFWENEQFQKIWTAD